MICSAMSLIRANSSSSLPLVMVSSSSRLKWVNRPWQMSAVNERAGANMPACIISWARPTLRRSVDLPPWLAPVIITRCLPFASMSFPTTRLPRRRLRHGSYRPRLVKIGPPGEGEPLPTSHGLDSYRRIFGDATTGHFAAAEIGPQ